MFHHRTLVLCFALVSSPVFAQDSATQDKSFDVRSSVGDLHVGKDADARKAGLPRYPGARAKQDPDSDSLNFGVLTESFGLKLVVAKYESDDAPARIISFYRDKLKRYGKVLECHTHESGDAQANDNEQTSKEPKCEGDNTGPVTELKVGTENDQHIVAVQPGDKGKPTEFAIVYLHHRGKQGEI